MVFVTKWGHFCQYFGIAFLDFLGIELEKSLGLALVTLVGVANSNVAVLRIGSVLEASQLDRWISVAWNSGAIYQNANASSTSQSSI